MFDEGSPLEWIIDHIPGLNGPKWLSRPFRLLLMIITAPIWMVVFDVVALLVILIDVYKSMSDRD